MPILTVQQGSHLALSAVASLPHRPHHIAHASHPVAKHLAQPVVGSPTPVRADVDAMLRAGSRDAPRTMIASTILERRMPPQRRLESLNSDQHACPTRALLYFLCGLAAR
jgi:hypothetical protein